MNTAREQAKRLAELLRIERGVTADFLLALADFDREKGWVQLGYASLFDFLHLGLKLSRGNAHYRKTAAELVQKIPGVVPPLRDGRLCITTVIELAKVLTPENEAEVLPRFFHLSRQEAMAVAVALRPVENPPRRNVVTAIRPLAAAAVSAPPPLLVVSASPSASCAPVQPVERAGTVAAPAGGGPVQPIEPALPAQVIEDRDSAQPLDRERFRLRMTVSDRFLEKLRRAEDALSHALPGGDWEAILEHGLDLALAKAAKRKGLVENPREAPAAPPRSEHIPAHVAREVWTRDGGCCQWKLADGGICGSTRRCELDHVVAKALGGPATAENLRVLCRFHNQLHARQTFGDGWMDRYARRAS